jgi:hypothetical protein
VKIQPWPWHVQRQWKVRGKPIRPRIVDANGKPVRLGNVRQVRLWALAPLPLDRLTKLCHRAGMMHLQLQSVLGCNVELPKTIRVAEEVERLARRCC